MPRYSLEHKSAVLKKLLPPENRKVSSVSALEGIPFMTLYSWLKQCREKDSLCKIIVRRQKIGFWI
jgi:transposase-like protein